LSSEPSRDDVVAALESVAWNFAKSMPHIPHWYTLRWDWKAKVPFEAVVTYIREHGSMRKFGSATLTYFDHGWTYWTMGASLPATILINRAKIVPSHDPSL
jgi:hypothetical protein